MAKEKFQLVDEKGLRMVVSDGNVEIVNPDGLPPAYRDCVDPDREHMEKGINVAGRPTGFDCGPVRREYGNQV